MGIINLTSKIIGKEHPRNVTFSTFLALHKRIEYKKISNNKPQMKEEL